MADGPKRFSAGKLGGQAADWEIEEWSERQDSNLSTAIDYQAVTKPDTQGDSQIQVALGHDLSQVVTAWEKLPAPLKAAILAIIKTAE